MRKLSTYLITLFFVSQLSAQNIVPSPSVLEKMNGNFLFEKQTTVAYSSKGKNTLEYLQLKFSAHQIDKTNNTSKAQILLQIKENTELGAEGYQLNVTTQQIIISANTEAGLFYGVQSLLQLLPAEVAVGKKPLAGVQISCLKITDKPKYAWRSFMLDSGRQYQTPEFIKKYLNHMAMLKMNVFHWHLTEGQGWRIEIKKYPKLTSIGSKVADGDEQQGYYTQEEIKDIVAYAAKLHIQVVPEIDVPGHSEAALMAYPELTCFGEAPKTVMAFTPNLFCGGKESTYEFLQNVLDEVCELFPGQYIHLGGDEAPKANWDKCPDCQAKIKAEGLKDSHDLQLYFSKRLANYLKQKGKKVIFWGDVVYHDGTDLPDNVVVYWWNWRGHKDTAYKNAIKRGHQVICGTNYYTYLNFPLTPWNQYAKNRTFDFETIYNENPSDLDNPNPRVLGMGTCLWTDWYVKQYMIDQRVFPRIFVMAEQMWNSGERLPMETFYEKVESKYELLELLDINYGPAFIKDVPSNYKWD